MGNKSATLNVLMIGNADEEAHPKEFYDSLGIGRKRFLVGDKLATTEEEMSKCSEYFHIGRYLFPNSQIPKFPNSQISLNSKV